MCGDTYLSRRAGGCKLLNHALTKDTCNFSVPLRVREAIINAFWNKRRE